MKTKALVSAIVFGSTIAAAFASHLPSGTEVMLTFQQPVNSKSAYAGERVKLAVANDVVGPNGRVALRAGTPVWGTIDKVNKRSHFGVNARIRIDISPINGIPLQPRDKGAMVGGTRTDMAAAASGGAALVFGPLGLVGGYFVVGHNVNIHPGDHLRTEVVNQ